MLATRVWWALERQGLHPHLGFLHTSRRGRPGLVFDLMEEFRQPLVDRAVIGMIGRGATIAIRKNRFLTLRTRARVERAIERGLARPVRRRTATTLGAQVVRQARTLRRVLMKRGAYRGYLMPW
jgi:CRISPR-associated protein Cas1